MGWWAPVCSMRNKMSFIFICPPLPVISSSISICISILVSVLSNQHFSITENCSLPLLTPPDMPLPSY
ncbi:hypothetical protein XENTR_v10009401 [Xenopus tropicalis]|nr:hypothetical protein XENTR_v10009401 [Xenopus tropicalis]